MALITSDCAPSQSGEVIDTTIISMLGSEIAQCTCVTHGPSS